MKKIQQRWCKTVNSCGRGRAAGEVSRPASGATCERAALKRPSFCAYLDQAFKSSPCVISRYCIYIHFFRGVAVVVPERQGVHTGSL